MTTRIARAGAAGLLAAMLALVPMAGTAGDPVETRRIAIHVDDSDPARIALALNNAANLERHYASAGVPVEIRIVTYGPGLTMLRADTSPVADRIAQMALEFPNLSFAACANTHRAMSAKAGAEVPLLEEAELVPSGVVELVELQRQGWTYIRP